MKIPEIKKITRSACHKAEGLVVVIDVIRAFTTAAFAFAQGAEKIIAVATIDDALNLHKEYPDYLLVGEQEGYPVPGFHFGNSPYQVSRHDLLGKTLVQRTSSGTQGVVRSINAERMLVSSFVVAEATYQRILSLQPELVTFVITGQKSGGIEDWALADYLEAKILGKKVNPKEYIQKVIDSPCTTRWLEDEDQDIVQGFLKDLDAVIKIDHFPFALEVFPTDGKHIIKPVTHNGQPWS